jgi:hypothetical protein
MSEIRYPQAIFVLVAGILMIYAVLHGERRKYFHFRDVIVRRYGVGCFGTTIAEILRTKSLNGSDILELDRTKLLLRCYYGGPPVGMRINLLS